MALLSYYIFSLRIAFNTRLFKTFTPALIMLVTSCFSKVFLQCHIFVMWRLLVLFTTPCPWILIYLSTFSDSFYQPESYHFCFLRSCNTNTENNPLQRYYLSTAVPAALSFSMIVYQDLCWHNNWVNNRWFLSVWLICDSEICCHFYGNREILWISRVPPREYWTWEPAAVTPSCLPVPPPWWGRGFTAALLFKVREGRKETKKKNTLRNQCDSLTYIHSGPPINLHRKNS